MSIEPSSADQNVARALRANLQGVQRQSEELHQAIADLVAACSSNRPANALPHLVRAEASAASLAAVLEVLAKFVAGSSSSQPSRRTEDRIAEQKASRDEADTVERAVEQSSAPSFVATPVAPAPAVVAPQTRVVEVAAPVHPEARHQMREELHEEVRETAREEADPELSEPIQAVAEAPAEIAVHEQSASPAEIESPEPVAESSEPLTHESPAAQSATPWEVVPTAHSGEPVLEEQPVAAPTEEIAEPIQEASVMIVPPPAEAHEPLPIEAFASSQHSSDEIEVVDSDSADFAHNGHIAEGSIAEAMGFAATQPVSHASLEQSEVFDINALPAEQQEMHRRANRVAKVSMQDIQLLRPDLVQQGRVTKDICIRLRDEIEKARREYDRRFRPILGQGADYFYHWMVEVLGAGDPETLGEYPYHAPILRH